MEAKEQGTDASNGGAPSCRVCSAALESVVVDLGSGPLCEKLPLPEELNDPELFYPLHAWVCSTCWLVQLEKYIDPADFFTEYFFYSSMSEAWMDHIRAYEAAIVERLGLGPESTVVEIGSNDGYLLQYILKHGIRALGVDSSPNLCAAAEEKGVTTLNTFFTPEVADRLVADGWRADLLVANNILAKVPELHDFLGSLAKVLKPDGMLTFEVMRVQDIIDGNQFDKIYHENVSYFAFAPIERALREHGLVPVDVEKLETHGGSMRVYAMHEDHAGDPSPSVAAFRREEIDAGLCSLDYYAGFAEQVYETKRKLLEFLIQAKREGKSVACYGAPGKGIMLLNYCGIRRDFIDYTVDKNPLKQGRFLSGTYIPIFDPAKLQETKPDYILILPWNWKDEIMAQLAPAREWGARFVLPIPQVEVC